MLAALALLAGCSSAGSRGATADQIPVVQPPALPQTVASRIDFQAAIRPIAGPGYIDPNPMGVGHVFVSDPVGGAVDIFTGTKQTGQITGLSFPQGITADRAGTLYVANTNADNVEEFAAPYGHTPTAIIADGGGTPAGVAVSSSGIVAVLNICAGPNCSLPGSVDFYAKGSTTLPCAVLYGGIAATPLAGAFDDNGTFYLGALNSGRVAQISEIKGGCKARTITALTTSNTISFPIGLQVDRNDNVAILDSYAISKNQIDIYAHPAKHSTMLTLLSTALLLNAQTPSGFALTANGTDLYTADFAAEQAMEYAYPAGGTSILQLTPSPPSQLGGVAITPAEFP